MPGRDTPQSPFRGGAVGERNAARFFAASAALSRGVWGTKLWPSILTPFGSDEASQNAQKLRIGGPGAAHVEVFDAEVRALHVVKPNSPSQGQPLNRSIRNRAAKPSVLQQLLPREALSALQADQVPLHGFHGQKGALLHLAAGTYQSQPRPDRLRRIRRHCTASLVLHHQGIGGCEPAILPIVDLQSLRVGDDEAHVGLSPPREAPTSLPHGSGQRDLLRSLTLNQVR